MPPFPKIKGVTFALLRGYVGYAASDDGRIWSCKERFGRGFVAWHELATHPNRGGYPRVDLYSNGARRMSLVHRLVLDAFVPCPDDTLDACHAPDPTPTNCRLANLQWGTRKDNMSHANEQGRICRGELRSKKLKETDVLKIYELRRIGLTHEAIARGMNLNRKSVGDILAGNRWKHLHHHFKETDHE